MGSVSLVISVTIANVEDQLDRRRSAAETQLARAGRSGAALRAYVEASAEVLQDGTRYICSAVLAAEEARSLLEGPVQGRNMTCDAIFRFADKVVGDCAVYAVNQGLKPGDEAYETIMGRIKRARIRVGHQLSMFRAGTVIRGYGEDTMSGNTPTYTVNTNFHGNAGIVAIANTGPVSQHGGINTDIDALADLIRKLPLPLEKHEEAATALAVVREEAAKPSPDKGRLTTAFDTLRAAGGAAEAAPKIIDAIDKITNFIF